MDNRILVAGGTLAGLAVGAVGGYFLAKKRYELAFAEALKEAVDEEVANVELHYKLLTKRGEEYASPEAVLARRTPQKPEGLDDSVHVEETSIEDLERIRDGLKYWKGDDSRIIGSPPSKPLVQEPSNKIGPIYQIQEEAFFAGDEEYEQVSMVWYSGDEVLATVEGDEIYDCAVTLGRELKLEEFDQGQHVLYFRNSRSRVDYEVNLSEHSYGEYVAGIDPKVA
jgi:hypothetical protein